MKTRNLNKQIETVQQGGGCCGSTPVQVQSVQSSCFGSTQSIEEKPQTGGGCC